MVCSTESVECVSGSCRSQVLQEAFAAKAKCMLTK